MLDEGAGDLDAAQFQERMEEIAMRMGFDDGRDHLYGSFETLTANRDEAVELLRLALTKPRFDADAVERMREPAAGRPRLRASAIPTAWPAAPGASAAFADHPYGRPAERHRRHIAGHHARRSRGLPQARLRHGHA